ncbi:hypothetical protein Plhal304r1_c051g0133811 [Plasmopara halstedii]
MPRCCPMRAVQVTHRVSTKHLHRHPAIHGLAVLQGGGAHCAQPLVPYSIGEKRFPPWNPQRCPARIHKLNLTRRTRLLYFKYDSHANFCPQHIAITAFSRSRASLILRGQCLRFTGRNLTKQ